MMHFLMLGGECGVSLTHLLTVSLIALAEIQRLAWLSIP